MIFRKQNVYRKVVVYGTVEEKLLFQFRHRHYFFTTCLRKLLLSLMRCPSQISSLRLTYVCQKKKCQPNDSDSNQLRLCTYLNIYINNNIKLTITDLALDSTNTLEIAKRFLAVQVYYSDVLLYNRQHALCIK